MPNLVTWMRAKDEPHFAPFFARAPALTILNAARGDGLMAEAGGLLLTGGADIAPDFLKQAVPVPQILQTDTDPERDRWEFAAVHDALERGLPIFAICKGMQLLNVALGGTLHLDIPGHNVPEMKTHDVQSLRTEAGASHRYEKVNSSHHQAVDQLGDGLEVEAWCASDDIIEQIRRRDSPFVLGVQYHPERGTIYNALFDDFFARVVEFRKARQD